MHGNSRGQKIIHNHQTNISLNSLKISKKKNVNFEQSYWRSISIRYYLNLVGKHAKELGKESSRILVKIHVVAGKDLLEELGLF